MKILITTLLFTSFCIIQNDMKKLKFNHKSYCLLNVKIKSFDPKDKCNYNFHSNDIDYKEISILNFRSIINKNEPYDTPYNTKRYPCWNQGKLKDTNQFERFDYLKFLTLGKSNDHIFQVYFTDIYDYKESIHLVNFSKKDSMPKSSIILLSIGGDAEDIWITNSERLDPFSFKVTEMIGKQKSENDTIQVLKAKTTHYEIDSLTGKRNILRIDTRKDFKYVVEN